MCKADKTCLVCDAILDTSREAWIVLIQRRESGHSSSAWTVTPEALTKSFVSSKVPSKVVDAKADRETTWLANIKE